MIREPYFAQYTAAYSAYCRANGLEYHQPVQACCRYVNANVVELRDTVKLIATYNWQHNKFEVPAELANRP